MDKGHPIKEKAQEQADGCWLVLEYPDNPTIRLDARMLDRILADDDRLVLAIADMTIGLRVGEGAVCARELATRLSQYSRSAPITTVEAYDAAIHALAIATGRGDDRTVIFVGNDAVVASQDLLHIGEFVCWISDVERYLSVGAVLPLPSGALQAGLAMLAVAARLRQENADELSRRIADYNAGSRNSNA